VDIRALTPSGWVGRSDKEEMLRPNSSLAVMTGAPHLGQCPAWTAFSSKLSPHVPQYLMPPPPPFLAGSRRTETTAR
jgi:hypothetical protein